MGSVCKNAIWWKRRELSHQCGTYDRNKFEKPQTHYFPPWVLISTDWVVFVLNKMIEFWDDKTQMYLTEKKKIDEMFFQYQYTSTYNS